MVHNVAEFLARQAQARPESPAVRSPAGRTRSGEIRYHERSFSELEAEASMAAYYLEARGVGRGTRVLLMVKPGLDLIRIVFALFKIGAVPIVIDPGMGLQGFLRCVRHSRPEVLVGLPVAALVSRLFVGSFRGLRARVAVTRGFARAIRRDAARGSFPVVDSAPDELAAILFTSGSTGPAKGVCYEHGMFAAQVEAIRRQYAIEPGEVDLPMLPVFALFNPALGMCTVVPEMNPSRPARVDPAKIVRAIRQNGVTNSFGSPALWTKIARHCAEQGLTLPSIRRILMAGAPVPPALMRRMRAIVPNGEIHSPYGATEALPVSSISASEVLDGTEAATAEGKGTCVGGALPGVSVRVIEPVDEPLDDIRAVRELPPGGIGEIIVKGPSVTRRYDGLPEADRRSKILEGEVFWHRMGDLGWLDEGGRLWFCGRKAERVGEGEPVFYTDCCEAIFNAHPRVFRSALIDLGGGRPGIVVEPEAGAFPKSAQAREAFCRELEELARRAPQTAPIREFFFEKRFPVDVRHNAKIHRLSLGRKIRGD